jgi:hypothetical protein
MSPLTPKTPATERLPVSFHRKFALVRSEIASILTVCAGAEKVITRKVFEEQTTLGSTKREAVPNYARGCGLVEFDSFQITSLGMTVFNNDPNLIHPATLWLMHYHLSAPMGPGPLFWHYCITQRLRPGNEIETKKLKANITQFLQDNGEKELDTNTTDEAAGKVLGSYSSNKEDALSKLGLLEFIKKDHYRVLEPPEPPPVFAIGYALAHFWESVHGDAGTINMSSLSEPQGFADLLYLSEYQLKDALRTLQREGLLELWRQAPPFQVVKLWQSKSDFLERLFL